MLGAAAAADGHSLKMVFVCSRYHMVNVEGIREVFTTSR
jgi:hypothetical protein